MLPLEKSLPGTGGGGYKEVFETQVKTLLGKRYPLATRMSEEEFLRRCIDPLRERIGEIQWKPEEDCVPLLIVIRFGVARPDELMSRIMYRGNEGMTHLAADAFEGVGKISDNPSYLAYGIRTKRRKTGDPIPSTRGGKGAVLSVEEGIALLTHYPDILNDGCLPLADTDVGEWIPGICKCKGYPELNRWKLEEGAKL